MIFPDRKGSITKVFVIKKKKKKGGLLRQSGLKTAALNQEIAKLKNVDTVFVLINSVTNFCITA